MKRMITLFSLAALAAGLAVSTPAWSQGRGGGQGSQQKGQDASMAQKGGRQGQQAAQGAYGDRIRDHQRVHLSQQQQACFTKSSELAHAAMNQARGMAGGSGHEGFGPELARRQRDALQGQIHGMLAEHERMTQGLTETDRTRLEERLMKLDRVRDRMTGRLAALDAECDGSGVNADRFVRRSRELERDLKAWRKHHRKLGTEVDTGSG